MFRFSILILALVIGLMMTGYVGVMLHFLWVAFKIAVVVTGVAATLLLILFIAFLAYIIGACMSSISASQQADSQSESVI
jgi:hypothetical protein